MHNIILHLFDGGDAVGTHPWRRRGRRRYTPLTPAGTPSVHTPAGTPSGHSLDDGGDAVGTHFYENCFIFVAERCELITVILFALGVESSAERIWVLNGWDMAKYQLKYHDGAPPEPPPEVCPEIGTLTAWNDERGFGFITPKEGGRRDKSFQLL